MTKESESPAHFPKPWYWGLTPHVPQPEDGPYAKELDALPGYYRNVSGLRLREDIRDNLAFSCAHAMKKLGII